MLEESVTINVEISSSVLRKLIKHQRISASDLKGLDAKSKAKVKQWILQSLLSDQ